MGRSLGHYTGSLMKIETMSKSGGLKEKLLKRINSGCYKPGDKIESVRNLASEFQISKHTAEKAISALVTEGYFYQEQGRGTFYSGNRQKSMRPSVARFLAFHTGASEKNSGEFISDIVRGCCQAASENQLQMLVYYQDSLEKSLASMNMEDIEGIVLYYQPEHHSLEYLREISQKTKLVLVNNDCHGLASGFVALDNEKAGQMITDYLIEKGHRKIGFISWPPDVTSIQERLTGYKISLASHNIPVDNRLISLSLKDDFENYYNSGACFEEILKADKDVSAIICINEGIAASLCKYLGKNKIKIPGDVAVTGFGDSILARFAEAQLTVVEQSGYDMGYAAGKLIADKKTERIILEPSIIKRESA